VSERRFPDGIALGSDGNFWVALISPPLPAFQAVAPFRAGRWLAAWLLQLYRPKVPRFGMVVQVSAVHWAGCHTQHVEVSAAAAALCCRVSEPAEGIGRGYQAVPIILSFRQRWQTILTLPRSYCCQLGSKTAHCRCCAHHSALQAQGDAQDEMCVWQVSPEGKPLRSLTDLDGQSISGISGVVEHGARLYFGFLTGNYISYVDLKPAPSNTQKILA